MAAQKSVSAFDSVAVFDACCAPVTDSVLDEDQAQVLAAAFVALADPVRLRLLSIIASAGGEEVCACDLIEPSGRSQPTVSHHMKILADAGLVTRESAVCGFGIEPRPSASPCCAVCWPEGRLPRRDRMTCRGWRRRSVAAARTAVLRHGLSRSGLIRQLWVAAQRLPRLALRAHQPRPRRLE